MSKCSTCNKTGVAHCACCEEIYCSECVLIAGKRSREEGGDCFNVVDPFTLESLDMFEDNLIISIKGHCFHLPSLYDWVWNRKNNTNPNTNLPFSMEEQIEIRQRALERFGLSIVIKEINGKARNIVTTTLESIEAFFITLVSNGLEKNVQTFFQAMEALAQSYSRFVLSIGDRNLSLISALEEFAGRTLSDFIQAPVLSVYLIRHVTTPSTKVRNEQLRAIALARNYPTGTFDRMIQSADEALQRAERGRERRDRMQEARNANEIDRVQPPGTIRVFVKLNTPMGSDYGSFPIFVRPNATLENIAQDIIHQKPALLEFPDRQARGFIYAGRLYTLGQGYRIDEDLGDFGADRTLFMIF